MKVCPQCGDRHSIDRPSCPSCGYDYSLLATAADSRPKHTEPAAETLFLGDQFFGLFMAFAAATAVVTSLFAGILAQRTISMFQGMPMAQTSLGPFFWFAFLYSLLLITAIGILRSRSWAFWAGIAWGILVIVISFVIASDITGNANSSLLASALGSVMIVYSAVRMRGFLGPKPN